MTRFLVKRVLNMIPLLFIVTILSFGIMQLAPGGPEYIILSAEADAMSDPQAVEALREKWGLNDPIPVQYFRWVGNMLTGDLGRSYYFRLPVTEVLGSALPNTIRLNLFALVFIYGLSIPLGVISAVRQYSKTDMIVTATAFAGQAAPSFWVATMLIWGVAMKSGGLIPTNGIATPGITFETYGWISVLADRAKYMILPVTVMVFGSLTGLTRYMRSAMLEVLKEDYIRTARAKGLSHQAVIIKHALRNALIPVVTLLGLNLPGLLGGAIITESIFLWPGIGRLTYTALLERDYPVLMALNLMFAGLTLLGSLLADIGYAVVDPRVRFE